HLLDRKPRVVERAEDIDDVLGGGGGQQQLAGVVASIEAHESHRDVNELLDGHRACRTPGRTVEHVLRNRADRGVEAGLLRERQEVLRCEPSVRELRRSLDGKRQAVVVHLEDTCSEPLRRFGDPSGQGRARRRGNGGGSRGSRRGGGGGGGGGGGRLGRGSGRRDGCGR